MTQPDQTYIDAIRTGNPEGLRSIYREFLPMVSGLVTRSGGRREEAQDVFQDALMVMYEKCRSDGFTLTSSFSTYLYGIARNIWGNRLQKKSRTEVTLPDDFKLNDQTNLLHSILQAEEERIFWDAFQRLGDDCQKLLQLFFEKIKMEEITTIMQYGSVGYTKKRKFQCKEQLISWVQKDPRYLENHPAKMP